MTQPVTPPADNGHTLAVAAIGLALIAVEARVRQEVEDDITAALTTIAAAAIVAAAAGPATLITGNALLSLASFHKVFTTTLTDARDNVATSIEAGYTAAAQVAHTKITAELAPEYHVPAELPELDPTIDVILADIDTMFGHAQTDIAANIAHAYDTAQTPDARTITINNAVDTAGKRLQNRAATAAGTAIQQGSSDAQQALYNQYQNSTGTPGLMKRWTVTSATPCEMCAALNGTMVGINAEFDHNTAYGQKDYRRIWRNLYGPPRHPNCRCQLELVKT